MKLRRLRATGWWVLPAVVTALLTLLTWEPRWFAAPALLVKPASPDCRRADQVQQGYMLDDSSIQKRPNGILLSGESWLQIDVCKPGTLLVTGQGQLAGMELPQLIVSDGEHTLQTLKFSGVPSNSQLTISKPVRIFMAYLNDFHTDQTRTITLKDFRIRPAGCGSMSVDVPTATGGQWYPREGIATLQYDKPMTLKACKSGTLEFALKGTIAGKQFPTLEVSQAGVNVLTHLTKDHYTRLSVSVQAGTIRLRLKNPYRTVLSDRNILLTRIEIRH